VERSTNADDEPVTLEKRDRGWFGPAAIGGWVLALLVMTVGGFVAWVGLGIGLCEDEGSPGSDGYCNHGGWEASGFALAALAAFALLVPAAGLAAGNPRLFVIGLLSPLALGVLIVVVSATLGAA
jgi:hypothetical protein